MPHHLQDRFGSSRGSADGDNVHTGMGSHDRHTDLRLGCRSMLMQPGSPRGTDIVAADSLRLGIHGGRVVGGQAGVCIVSDGQLGPERPDKTVSRPWLALRLSYKIHSTCGQSIKDLYVQRGNKNDRDRMCGEDLL